MASLNGSVGSKGADLHPPRDPVGGQATFFSGAGGSLGGGVVGADDGSGAVAVRSCWIRRLRPPPPPSRPLLPPPASAAAAASSERGAGATGKSRTRTMTPPAGPPSLVRGHVNLFRGKPPPPPRPFSSRPLSRDAPSPPPASSTPSHVPRQQREQREEEGRPPQEPEGEQDRRRGAAGFGPFQLSTKRARLLLPGTTHNQPQQKPEHSQWRLEGSHGGGSGAAAAGVPDKGSYYPYRGNGCFPIFQKRARLGTVCEGQEVADKDRKDEEEDEGKGAPWRLYNQLHKGGAPDFS